MLEFLSKDIGIDLGTANTLVTVKGKGIVVREPSVVAIDTNTDQVLAVGAEAKEMIGRTPGNIKAIRPLKDGVIADYDVTQKMLKYFIKKAIRQNNLLAGPRVIIGVPSEVTEVEKRAVIEAGLSAGAKKVLLIEESMAAAIGSGIDVAAPSGSMIVDIGGGTSEIAVISLGGIVTSKSLRHGGDHIDQTIESYIRKKYSIVIGSRTSEKIKIQIASAHKDYNKEMEITGRNLINGLPKKIVINSHEIREAISDSIYSVIDGIKSILERTPPELSSDLIKKGIMLTGGGALLKGLDKLINEETGLPVYIAGEPLDCVVKGTEKAIEDFKRLEQVFISRKQNR
jgi:rod shape-determining protein MreB